MRVLQVIAGAEHGGAESYFVRLTLALARAGLEQRVAMRRNEVRAARLREGGLAPVEMSFGGALDLATRFALRRLAAACRPDVMVTWMSRASGLAPRGPFVHLGRLGGYYDLKYYRHCHHLVANTADILAYLVGEGWPAERAHHIPNFVALDQAPALARGALDTAEGAPLVLALGRLHANKAFDVLLRALARVPDAVLWLAGEGPERPSLEGLARELGVAPRVRFLGWREDVAALLGAADLCVVPSRREPFGNVVVEAWAAGVPLVAAAAAGPAALIADGVDGLVVAVDDVEALAAAITRLSADRALGAGLAAAGRARWRGAFTEDKVVARWRDLFERVRA